MFTHHYFVDFDIACSICLACRANSFNFLLRSDTQLVEPTSDELLGFMEEEVFECYNCNKMTPAIITRIELSDDRKIRKQLKLNVLKDGERIIVRPFPGQREFEKYELGSAFELIYEKLMTISLDAQQHKRYKELDNASGLIIVNFNKNQTKDVFVLETFGFSWLELAHTFIQLQTQFQS